MSRKITIVQSVLLCGAAPKQKKEKLGELN